MDVAQAPGITVDGDDRRVLDKEYRGVRIYACLGRVTQADAAWRLQTEIRRGETRFARRSNCPPRFADIPSPRALPPRVSSLGPGRTAASILNFSDGAHR